MWPFRTNPRLEVYLKTPAVLAAAENWYGGSRSFARFLLRFSEAQAERVIEAYRVQAEAPYSDPIESDPTFVQDFAEVGAEIHKLYPERRRGQCHRLWRRKKAMLRERGIDWLSPYDLNPFARFD
jgi:hypothetical protein